MDAIAAFGLACNVVQVVNFSMDVVSICQELYRGGSLSKYDHLEDMANHLVGLRDSLESPTGQVKQNLGKCQDQALLDLAGRCSTIATELFAELQKLKIRGSPTKRHVISKSARSLWKQGSIDKIRIKLDEYRKILDSRILIGIRSVTSLLTPRTDATDHDPCFHYSSP